MKTETKFDRRIIDRDGPPPGYEKYLETLKCCCCGSRQPCTCTAEDYKKKR